MREAKSAVACGLLVAAVTSLTGCQLKPKDQLAITKPKGVESYVQGVKAMDEGDRERAVDALQRAIAQNPKLITPRMLLGGVYRDQGQYQSALLQYETLVKLDPYTAANHYYLGLCYQLVDRLREAAESYRNALKLDPKNVDTNTNLGLVYLATGQVEDATRYTKAATELDPKSAVAWANYGVALDAAGDYPTAEAAYRRSLELDSSQPSTVLNLAANLVLQNRGSDALPLFEQSLPKQDSAMMRKRYGDALAQVKRFDTAILQYDAALKLNPRYYAAYNAIGNSFIALYRGGYELDDTQRQSALAAWKKSMDINPNQPDTQALIEQWSKQPLLK